MRLLEEALGISRNHWLRRCDVSCNAASIFWTLGPRQVGKAAICGWNEVLQHRPESWKIWPFETVNPSTDRWIAEIYPTLAYRIIGLPRNFGKRYPSARKAQAGTLIRFAGDLGLHLDEHLLTLVHNGFGENADGEDPFDAFVALLGMVESMHRIPFPDAPRDEAVRKYEGWIFGLTDNSTGQYSN